MKKFSILLLLSFLIIGVKAQDKKGAYQFTTVKDIKHTSVKNQYRSGTCWSFSGQAFLEAEAIRMGKPEVDLSEMFVVYNSYYQKSIKYVRMHGSLEYGGGGAFNDVIDVLRNFGAIPEEAYNGINYKEENHIHAEMDAMLKAMVNVIIKNPNRVLTPIWPEAIMGTLNAYLGEIPKTFTYEGKEYTPRSFADDFLGLNPDDYVMLSSFNHHPFYKPFVLEVPDNWAGGSVYNLPIDEMISSIDNALNNGYTVAWAADVSEKGFQWSKGFAVIPDEDIKELDGLEQAKWEKLSKRDKMKMLYKFDKPVKEKVITQDLRQKQFDNYKTTDDHGMLLVGIAKDQTGKEFYKVKNSWGTNQKYDGYFYVSKAFVALKTTSLLVNKNSIPKKLRKKMNIK